MSDQTCKNFEKCPIYNGILKDKEQTSSAYKKNYCNAGEEGWNKCKRYLVKEQTGNCPPNLLPNSTQSLADIINQMKL